MNKILIMQSVINWIQTSSYARIINFYNKILNQIQLIVNLKPEKCPTQCPAQGPEFPTKSGHICSAKDKNQKGLHWVGKKVVP